MMSIVDDFFKDPAPAEFEPVQFLPFDFIPSESTYTISRKSSGLKFVCAVPLLDPKAARVEIFRGRWREKVDAADHGYALAACRAYCAKAGYPW